MDWNIILNEISFRTSRSSGAGGQHVNKTETKVEGLLDVNASAGLTEEEKTMVLENLRSRISDEGILAVTSQKSRSQVANKENVLERMEALITKALIPKIKRIRTKPTKQSIETAFRRKSPI